MQYQSHAALLAGVSLVILTACGSGSARSSANVTQVDLGQPAVFADGSPITSASFNGQTFPLYFVEGFNGGSGSQLRRGKGAAVVSADGNSLTLLIGDGDEVELDRVLATSTFVTDSIPAIFFAVDDLNVARTVRANDATLIGNSDIVGGFGYQTPSDLMPGTGTATYNTEGFGRLILSSNRTPFITSLESDSSLVSLAVDFDDGSVGGTLFNGGGFADVDGDGFIDDSLVVLVTLENGSISGGTFDGEVAGDAVAFIDDAIFVDLEPRFSNTDADGVFFGNGASRVAGTYEGDYRSRGPTGSFVGYFDVGLD